MATTNELRKEPRHELPLSNALRVLTAGGDCMADLLDFSRNGIGIRFYDFFCALDLQLGAMVKIQLLIDINAQYLEPHQQYEEFADASDRPAIDEMEEDQDIQEAEGIEEVASNGSPEAYTVPLPDPVVMEASVVWSYLNRLGLEFVNAPADSLYEALLELKGTQ